MVPAQLMEQLSSLKERKAELESQNAELHDENADLRAQLEWFKRNREYKKICVIILRGILTKKISLKDTE